MTLYLWGGKMIKGIGIDIIEIDRIRQAIAKNNKFIDALLLINTSICNLSSYNIR